VERLSTAPSTLGLPADVPVPAEMAGRCYRFNAVYNSCTGKLLYADAMTEFGPQTCP